MGLVGLIGLEGVSGPPGLYGLLAPPYGLVPMGLYGLDAPGLVAPPAPGDIGSGEFSGLAGLRDGETGGGHGKNGYVRWALEKRYNNTQESATLGGSEIVSTGDEGTGVIGKGGERRGRAKAWVNNSG